MGKEQSQVQSPLITTIPLPSMKKAKNRKISMQLESFASGAESAKLAKKNSSNLVPKSNEEYLYFRFKITYHSGTQTIKAKDVFNYYYNIFGANSTKQMTNLDWGFFFEDVDDLGQVLLSPGNTITCGKQSW